MHSKDFEKELKDIDPRFSIVENVNRPGLSNIFFDGKERDLPVVSTDLIKDEVDMGYRYEFPNGMRARFWTRAEILGRIEAFLKQVNSGEYEDLYAEEK